MLTKFLALLLPVCASAATCESVVGLKIADTTVNSALTVAAAAGVPAHCQVRFTVRPAFDSEINVELWLPPASGWNGKFVGTGNGGYSSAMSLNDMRNALAKGYATAGSDTGHQGGDLKFGFQHEAKIQDWAYRAVHAMTAVSKKVIEGYYAQNATQAYFTGCSTGGHQALMEAQRYPNDYDGIVAGDPANNRIRLNAGFLWNWLAVNKDPANPLPASKLPLINRAVVEVCDALDGIKDGIISDPRRCKFDPAVLECKGADEPGCLTKSQIAAVDAIYDGAHNPHTGERIFAGWERGSEWGGRSGSGWSGYFVGQPAPARADFWRLWAFENPDWGDLRKFNFDGDLASALTNLKLIDANDPDLSPFQKHKGRLIMYHGWADPVVPPEDGIRYYESVAKQMGGVESVTSFYRLFMVPGMAHCSGGPGPNSFDALGALDRWVTSGAAPDKIVASHRTNGVADRTRPLCPYPQIAKWTGSGSTDDAANFVCAVN